MLDSADGKKEVIEHLADAVAMEIEKDMDEERERPESVERIVGYTHEGFVEERAQKAGTLVVHLTRHRQDRGAPREEVQAHAVVAREGGGGTAFAVDARCRASARGDILGGVEEPLAVDVRHRALHRSASGADRSFSAECRFQDGARCVRAEHIVRQGGEVDCGGVVRVPPK